MSERDKYNLEDVMRQAEDALGSGGKKIYNSPDIKKHKSYKRVKPILKVLGVGLGTILAISSLRALGVKSDSYSEPTIKPTPISNYGKQTPRYEVYIRPVGGGETSSSILRNQR